MSSHRVHARQCGGQDMATNYLYSAIVNQKLAFARVELAAAAGHSGDTVQVRLIRHAHLDSAVAQVCSALRYFVAEVAEQYGLELSRASDDIAAALAEFAGSGKQSAEMAELNALLKKEGSWLADLLNVRTDPLLLAQRFKSQQKDATHESMVPLVDVTQQSSAMDPLALVEQWTHATQALVDRLRSSLHEE